MLRLGAGFTGASGCQPERKASAELPRLGLRSLRLARAPSPRAMGSCLGAIMRLAMAARSPAVPRGRSIGLNGLGEVQWRTSACLPSRSRLGWQTFKSGKQIRDPRIDSIAHSLQLTHHHRTHHLMNHHQSRSRHHHRRRFPNARMPAATRRGGL